MVDDYYSKDDKKKTCSGSQLNGHGPFLQFRRSESLDSSGTFSSSSQQQSISLISSFSSLPLPSSSVAATSHHRSDNHSKRIRRNQHDNSNRMSRIGIILRLLLLGSMIDYMYVFLIKDHVGVGGQNRAMFVSNNNEIIDLETIMDNPSTSTVVVAGGVSSSSSSTTSTATTAISSVGDGGGGVVLMGIFSHPTDQEIRDTFRQRILQIHNNNNNNQNDDNDNNDDRVVICNLDTYLQQQQQQQKQNKFQNNNNHCNFVYTFVMFGVGAKAKGSFMNEDTLKKTNNNATTTTTNTTTALLPRPPPSTTTSSTSSDHDILFLYNPSKKETKSQVWLKYVASKVKDMTSNIDYVAKLELPSTSPSQSQSLQTPQTTDNVVSSNNNNNNTTLLFDFEKFWNFVEEYLPNKQQKHLFVSSFTNYEYCDWPEHVLRVPSNIIHKPQPSRSTIHLYASKKFWLLSSDLMVDYTKITHIIELSEYWKHRNVLKLKSCQYLEEYELSTSSFQYYFNNEPLNIIPISEQYKFWNINNNNNKDGDDDNEDDNIASSNNNNNNTSSSSSSTLVSPPQPSQQQQRSVVATTRDNGVVLMGIFCQLQDKTFRDLFRNLFKMHPKACRLGTFIKKQQQQSSSSSSSSSSCEFVYGFVIGADTTNTTTTPTERVTGRLDEVLIMNHSKVDSSLLGEDEVMNGMHDEDDDDFVFLNIRENMEEGKSTTWLYAASLIANTYNIDYVGKMDTDTLFYLDRYFDFANKYLPPAPYNKRRIASAFADKAWWGYNVPFMHAGKEHSYTAEKETHFKTQYPGSDPTRFGIHIYLQGQMYIISQDLARGVAEMAHFVSTNSSSNVETAGGANGNIINNKKKKDYYRNHLENIEDLDVSTMAYLWLKEKPMNHILIKQTNKFWIHDYRLKERPGTIGMIRKWGEHLWEKEMNRLKNMTHF